MINVSVSHQVILKDVDSLLYVDTDVLFLRPMDDVWSLLKTFNGTQLAAMAPEHEVPKIGWYSRFARHPFYGVTGVNSGVMLMNLTRIRSTMFKVSFKKGMGRFPLSSRCSERPFCPQKRSAALSTASTLQTGACKCASPLMMCFLQGKK